MSFLSNVLKRGGALGERYPLGGKPERMIRQRELDEVLACKTREAFEAGFEEGSAKGYELGEREGERCAAEDVAARFKQEYADKFAALDALVREIGAARERLIRSAEREAVALAVTIASRVLCQQVEGSSVPPELVEEAVRQTMERTHVVVRLNPADRAAMCDEGRPLEALFAGAPSVEFVEDESVGRCGCVVESNTGIVDAQLDTQIEQLRRSLLA